MASRYDNYFEEKKAKQAWDKEQAAGVEDLSGPIGQGVAQTDWMGKSNMEQNKGFEEEIAGAKSASPEMGAAAGVQSAMANGGSPLDMAGSGMTSAGMLSANPYLVGAGLGVSALSSIQKGRNQREQNRYLAEVQKYNARQSAIQKMAQIGQGLKA